MAKPLTKREAAERARLWKKALARTATYGECSRLFDLSRRAYQAAQAEPKEAE